MSIVETVAPSRRVTVCVDGHDLTLSNLDKVLYPEVGFTKRDLIHYYASVGPWLLPHLAQRPLTMRRFPDGVDGKSFYEKHLPRSAPDWLGTVRVPSSGGRAGSDHVEHPLLSDIASLTWAVNLAAIELHVPLWRVSAGELPRPPDLMVFDLDPGARASIVECCEVAVALAPILEEDGFEVYPKTSGSKGLQLYMPIKDWDWPTMNGYAHDLARRLESELPDKVVSTQSKTLREGKVLIDWNQNSPSKTTVAVYSLRARPRPTVSTPVHWTEVMECVDRGKAEVLSFETGDVIDRLESIGDLFAPLLVRGEARTRT